MKTSNIILLVLISGITLFILSAFLHLRIAGHTVRYDPEYKHMDLPEYHYLIINNAENVTVVSSDKPTISLKTHKGQSMPVVDYHLKGDTLIIDKIEAPSPNGPYDIEIKVPEGQLVWISSQNSDITLKQLNVKNLTIKMAGGRTFIHSLGKNNEVDQLTINGNKAYVRAKSIKLDTLALNISQSNLYLGASVKKLKGSINNNSSVWVDEVYDLSFKKDKSSKFSHSH